jgi:2-keto-3-deoxy-L-rhamnonate aldolase RhmA
MRPNTLKEKLGAGGAALGSVVSITDPFVAEVMANAGFDFIIVDTEHCPFSIHQLQTTLIALRSSGQPVLVRAPWNDPVAVKQILDLGADGVIFPWISSREECAQAVAAAKYPPDGIRGWGPRRAIRLHGGPAEYARGANDYVMVLAQIERADAVERLDEILTTPGLDAIMVGPADLAASMGYLQDLENPAVEAMIDRILERCKANGVPFGMFTGTAEKARKWTLKGGQIATVGGDLVFIDAGIARAKQDIAAILAERGG